MKKVIGFYLSVVIAVSMITGCIDQNERTKSAPEKAEEEKLEKDHTEAKMGIVDTTARMVDTMTGQMVDTMELNQDSIE